MVKTNMICAGGNGVDSGCSVSVLTEIDTVAVGWKTVAFQEMEKNCMYSNG